MTGVDAASRGDPVFVGRSEMAALCREFDWGATSLGPVSHWPEPLRSAVRLMLEAPIPASLWCGPSYTLLYNDAYRRILGVKHPDALGHPGAEIWHELWPQHEAWFEQVRCRGTPIFADEARFILERGKGAGDEERWFSYALSPLVDEAGACLAVYNVAIDITDRVRARDALTTERARLFEAFQRVPSFISVVSGPDHVLEYANEAYYDLVGRRDILGRPIWEAIPDARGQGFEALLDSVRDTGVPVVGREAPLRLTRVPGAEPEQRYVDFTYQALTEADGTCWGVMGVGTDVTDHVRAREEVRRLLEESEIARARATGSELQIRTLADAIPTLAWTARADGYIEWYNARWYEYTGTTPEEMAGWGWQKVHDPEVLPVVMERWQSSIASGQPFEMTFPLRAADGRFRRFLTRVRPLHDESGRVTRWFGTNTDVEAERAAREAAEEANQAKTNFLATMSHELRTPLNAIAGYTELLEVGIHGPITPQQRDTLGRIQRSQRHLLGLINDVLNFAKLEAGRVEFHLADVPVIEVLDRLEPLVAPQLRAKSLTFSREEGSAPCVVRADADKLQQILINLLSNAIKFTPEGGAVTICCEDDDDLVHLRVRDTGIGIPEERFEHIFAPFVQINRRLNAPHEGTGLGLSISRDLARGMGGRLTVESSPGGGATFTVTLRRGAMQ